MSFNPSQNQLYKIHTALDKHFVVDCSGNPKELNQLILYKDHNGPNQKWAIRKLQNGKYAFFNSQNNGTL